MAVAVLRRYASARGRISSQVLVSTHTIGVLVSLELGLQAESESVKGLGITAPWSFARGASPAILAYSTARA